MVRAADTAYAIMRELILSGQLKPGDQLKEEEMAERTGLSRTPVRDAMQRLQAELFIHRTESQRSFVNGWSPDDIEEVFTLRTILEGYAARCAAMRATPALVAELQHSNGIIADAIRGDRPDVQAFIEENARYHRLIVQAAASERLAQMLNRVLLQPIVQRTALEYDSGNLARSLAEHVEVVAAIERRDPQWAEAVMTGHIRRAYHIYADAQLDQSA